jgi:tetratricopeptide (TPR) repeat protein
LLETFGRYEAIDNLADKALVAAERLEDDAALAALLYCLATIDHDGYMNYTRAVKRADLGRAVARDMGDWTLFCEFTFILAQAAWAEGDAELEKRHWDEIEQIAKPRHLDDILLRLAEARAWRAVWRGDYDFAEKMLAKFIRYVRRAKKTKLLWRSHDNLAYVFNRKGDFKRADSNYRRALEIAFEADGLRPITVLLGRAQNAVHWGELDLAQKYTDEALALSRNVARPRDILDTYIYSGDVAAARSDYPAARQLWERALEISRTSHAQAKECVTLARLGGLCVQEGNLSEAGNFLDGAWRIAERFREASIRGFVYEQLAYLSAARGETQQALAYGEKCLEIYDRRRLREAVAFRKWLFALHGKN